MFDRHKGDGRVCENSPGVNTIIDCTPVFCVFFAVVYDFSRALALK